MSFAPILLVDDDANDLLLTREALLAADIPNPVVARREGEEAIAFLMEACLDRSQLPAAVLIDLRLPGMHGLDVLAWIRAQEALVSLPVVVLSGSDNELDRAFASDLGALDYLVKNPEPEQLRAVWTRVMAKRAEGFSHPATAVVTVEPVVEQQKRTARETASGSAHRLRSFACFAAVPHLAPSGWREMSGADHFCQIYEQDAALSASLAEYAVDGLWRGECVIVIATEPHRLMLEQRLQINGIDVAEVTATGQYVVLDAAETLASFVTEGVVDPPRFDAVVGELMRRAVARPWPVRAFGEMVALLWSSGNPKAALTLEAAWNDLAKAGRFRLFCGYPLTCFCGDGAGVALLDMCETHSRVVPTESFATELEKARWASRPFRR